MKRPTPEWWLLRSLAAERDEEELKACVQQKNLYICKKEGGYVYRLMISVCNNMYHLFLLETINFQLSKYISSREILGTLSHFHDL